jgi:UDP-N-acetylglucosamine--N-acetylmuramyl-(pentapeptide) pyrophosphoryl-undecaprenol N-acetylglucosamine transferase
MAASDLVISRAGATAMAEVGMMKRPMILVPNPYLSGGHQIKNAEVFSENGSAVVVNEHEALENPRVLEREIQKLIDDADLRAKMSETLHKNTKKNASVKIAQLLVGEAEQGRQ